MEAEKAKEQEEALSEKLHDYENRLQDLESAYLDEKKNNTSLQMELEKLKEQDESFEKVVSKFYEVRERATGSSECTSLHAKCSTLLDDPVEMWIFDSDGKHAPSSYIDSLEEQIVALRESVDDLQQKMRMGMEIEQHLQKKVHSMEKQISAGNLFRHCLSTLRELHSQQRAAIMNVLEVENSEIKSVITKVQEKLRLLHVNNELKSCASLGEDKCDITDHKQEDITSDADVCATAMEEGPTTRSIAVDVEPDTSNVLAQALKEKVEALLLLSQQDERHLLERYLNQKKMEDLQRNLVQVTTEKVKALVELAQLKKDYQLLQENVRHGEKHVKYAADDGDKGIVTQERSAKLRNLLKKTYLRRWVGKDSESGSDIYTDLYGSSPSNKNGNHSMDLARPDGEDSGGRGIIEGEGAVQGGGWRGGGEWKLAGYVEVVEGDHEGLTLPARLKVENATLQESITNIGHFTSSIHKLRRSILKVIDDSRSSASTERAAMTLDDIFQEVDHLKTALGSSIPVSCSSAAEGGPSEQDSCGPALHLGASGNEKLDPITTAGFEMVELLILAAELVREYMMTRVTSSSLS